MKCPDITEKHVEQFNRDGFILFDEFIDRNEVNRALGRFDDIFDGKFETGVLPDKVKWLKGRDPEGVPRSMCNIWKADRVLAKVVLAEQIGRAAALLMGWQGTRCNQDFIMWVPPGAGTICMHKDNSYQDWHTPGGIITCWIALSETKAEGGTLEYVRGSHKWPAAPRVKQFAAPENYREELDEAAAALGEKVDIVPVVLPPGGVAFHHGNIWHGSDYNKSPRDRYSISTHCMNAQSMFHPTIPSPMFSHYKRFGDLALDESFFPILWGRNGERSQFIDNYCASYDREHRSK